jgi:heat shock protein HspQ
MAKTIVLYKPGQLIRHKRYGYRGVIVEADLECRADENWYLKNQTQPDRKQPWYHVLISDTDQITYPAQSSLLPDESCQEVHHPLINHFFSQFENNHHIRNNEPWPSS